MTVRGPFFVHVFYAIQLPTATIIFRSVVNSRMTHAKQHGHPDHLWITEKKNLKKVELIFVCLKNPRIFTSLNNNNLLTF